MNDISPFMDHLLKNKIIHYWLLCLLVLLMIGLIWSRAIVSIAPLLLAIPFVFNKANYLKNKWVIISIALMLFPILYSGWWSTNTKDWWKALSVKIQLFTLAIALLSGSFTSKLYQQIMDCFIIILLIACGWSVIQYLNNRIDIEQGYLFAKTIPTLSDGDYGFFNWLVLVVCWLTLFNINKSQTKIRKLLYAFAVTIFIVFIHLLAVKKALIGLYGALLMIALYAVLKQEKKKAFLVLLFICIGFIISYSLFPTLRNRIQYTVYDFKENIAKPFSAGSNDGARWLSVKAGYQLMQENPLIGVGFGDIFNEVNQWHQLNNPSTPTDQRIKPMNQWLTYGAGSGWPGLIIFSIGLIILYRQFYFKSAAIMGLLWIALVPLLTEDILEGQFGVAVFGLIFFFGIPYLKSNNNSIHESIGSHHL